tara:strand:+ start:19896 stop:20087 length:192 start_codon:yes stop_codon:yes gene_type:complete
LEFLSWCFDLRISRGGMPVKKKRLSLSFWALDSCAQILVTRPACGIALTEANPIDGKKSIDAL